MVDAFIAASRNGDFGALLKLLDPDIVVRADAAATPAGVAIQLRGADAVARQALMFSGRARHAEPALVDGAVGIVVAPHGRLSLAMAFTIDHARITGIDIVADVPRLHHLDLALLDR